MSAIDEQRVRDFLQPLAGIEPVRRPAGEPLPEAPSRHPAYLRYGAILLGGIALIAVISLIAGHRSAVPPPAKHPPDRGIFAKTRGWITFQGSGGEIRALNPAHPGRIRMIAKVEGTPLAWSRDGTELLIVGARADLVLHADGSMTTVARPRRPNIPLAGGSFTADGSHVIYEKDGSLWSAPANGGRPIALVRRDGHAVYLLGGWVANQLSPDGRTLAFIKMTAPNLRGSSVGAVDADGRNQRTLATFHDILNAMGDPHGEAHIEDVFPAAWFGDSSGLVILAAAKTRPCALLAVDADGSNLRLWGPPGLCPTRAALSPDGKTIAFYARYHRKLGFVIVDRAGQVTRFVRVPGDIRPAFFTWQP